MRSTGIRRGDRNQIEWRLGSEAIHPDLRPLVKARPECPSSAQAATGKFVKEKKIVFAAEESISIEPDDDRARDMGTARVSDDRDSTSWGRARNCVECCVIRRRQERRLPCWLDGKTKYQTGSVFERGMNEKGMN